MHYVILTLILMYFFSFRLYQLNLVYNSACAIHLTICSTKFPGHDKKVVINFLHTSVTFLLYSLSKYLEACHENKNEIVMKTMFMLQETLNSKISPIISMGGVWFSNALEDIKVNVFMCFNYFLVLEFQCLGIWRSWLYWLSSRFNECLALFGFKTNIWTESKGYKGKFLLM